MSVAESSIPGQQPVVIFCLWLYVYVVHQTLILVATL